MKNAMKRWLSLLLTVLMVTTALPFAALAEGDTAAAGLIEEDLVPVEPEQAQTTPTVNVSNAVSAAELLAAGTATNVDISDVNTTAGESVTVKSSVSYDNFSLSSITAVNQEGKTCDGFSLSYSLDWSRGNLTLQIANTVSPGVYTVTAEWTAGRYNNNKTTYTSTFKVTVSKYSTISLTIIQGATVSQSIQNATGLTFTNVPNGLTVTATSANSVTIEAASNAQTGSYTITYTDEDGNSGAMVVTVAASSSRYSYQHVDFRADATVNLVVYNADGTISNQSVKATVTNPTTRIYNTSGVTWDTSSNSSWKNLVKETDSGMKYFDVTYTASSAENEFRMQSSLLDRIKVYEGDMLVVTFDLTYVDPTTNKEVTIENVKQTVYINRNNNVCTWANNSQNRAYDFEVSADDITTAMTNTTLQISKEWVDGGEGNRPDSITVKVNHTANGTTSEFMTLELNKNKSQSTYTLSAGFADRTDVQNVKVEFKDNYGVNISGLPYQEWITVNGAPKYVTATYTVTEPEITGVNGTPLYGTKISYIGDGEKNEYIVVLTNKLSYEKLAVKKLWKDASGNDLENPTATSIDVTLSASTASGTVDSSWLASFIGGSTKATLTAANNWYHEWGYMPVYDASGNKITDITLTETITDSFGTEYLDPVVMKIGDARPVNGVYVQTITNQVKPKTMDVIATKKWEDRSDQYGIRPESIELTLMANGVKVEQEGLTNPATVTADTDGTWSYTWENVPINDSNGNTITYTVTETAVPGYTSVVTGDAANGFTVTNTLKTHTLTIKKQVEGNMGSWNKQFAFTTSYGDGDKIANLVHDGTAQYTVPYGATVTVTEDPDGYKLETIAVQPTTVTTTNVDNGASFTMPDEDVTIIFTNSNKAEVDTGILLDSLPYVLILALVAVALVVWFARRRRDD